MQFVIYVASYLDLDFIWRKESQGTIERGREECQSLHKYGLNVIGVSSQSKGQIFPFFGEQKPELYQLENKLFTVQKGRNRVSVINQVFFRGKFLAEQQQNNNGEMKGTQNLNKLQRYFIGTSQNRPSEGGTQHWRWSLSD